MNKSTEDIIAKFDVLIQLLHETRNTRGDIDGRGVSIAITHVETALLWFEDASKVEELSAEN
jgi:hypothetical protein